MEHLGRGGFATVWRAYDRTRHEAVAVKVLHGQYSKDQTRRERFFRGARKMAEVSHPGIVRVLDEHCEDDGFHYFVMEYVGGGGPARTARPHARRLAQTRRAPARAELPRRAGGRQVLRGWAPSGEKLSKSVP